MSRRPMSRVEFVVMVAFLYSTIAYSIDAILPALGAIGDAIAPDDGAHVHFVIIGLVLGMGIGTLFAGPLADRFGRKPTILVGAALYSLGALIGWKAQSLEVMVLARMIQGLGAAGPRVATMAIVRDMYSGAEMARLTSFIMVVFTLVPAVAPAMGAAIMAVFDWRAIFLSFLVFSALSALWLALRQPETLTPEKTRPLRLAPIIRGAMDALSMPMVRLSIAVQTLVFGMLFGLLSVTQTIYDQVYGRAAEFPAWFAGTALIAATGSVINARLVVRLGMRRMIGAALLAQAIAAGAMAATGLFGADQVFGLYFLWSTSVFFMLGLTIGNLTALALEPLGYMAGLGASLVTAIATIGGALVATPIAASYRGTPATVALAVMICAGLGYLLVERMKRLERAGTGARPPMA